jgi:hypothetical protein
MRRKVVIELTIQTGQSDSQAQRVFRLSDDYCPVLSSSTLSCSQAQEELDLSEGCHTNT